MSKSKSALKEISGKKAEEESILKPRTKPKEKPKEKSKGKFKGKSKETPKKRQSRKRAFRAQVMHEDTDLEAYITKNIKMSELSKGVMTKVMTEKDFFSDLADEHVIGVAGLLMLNDILQSEEIETFVVNWLIARKSRKGGRSRKDIVEMFKSLNEEISGLKSKFMDRFGGMFQ